MMKAFILSIRNWIQIKLLTTAILWACIASLMKILQPNDKLLTITVQRSAYISFADCVA